MPIDEAISLSIQEAGTYAKRAENAANMDDVRQYGGRAPRSAKPRRR